MDFRYRFYCLMHKTAKKALGKHVEANDYAKVKNSIIKLGVLRRDCLPLWNRFIYNSVIPATEECSGSLYAGYIADTKKWCLPSWIWTTAASVRVFANSDKTDLLKCVVGYLIDNQTNAGGG